MPVTSANALLVPTGDEYVLHTLTDGDQFSPVVAALAGGGYVVLWSGGSALQQGPIAIRAQVLDANGVRVGSEIVIDGSTNNSRDYKLEALAGGGFAVTWTDDLPGDGGAGGAGGTFGIFAQLFSATGASLAGPTQVNSTVLGPQNGTQIAELTDGKYVITWSNSNEYVAAQLFNANGTKLGGEFKVNSTDVFEQIVPKVTALQNGGFVITWEDHSATGGLGQNGNAAQIDVRAQFFNSAGAITGSEIVVNTTTAGRQAGAEITTLADGKVLVAWNDTSGDGEVRAQLLDPAGNKFGAEILVNTTTPGFQSTPVLQALAGGGFVVAWLSESGGVSVPRAQVFAGDGSKIGGEIEVRSPDGVQRGVGTIVALADGGFVIGWDKSPNNNTFNQDAFLQVFTANGTRVGAARMLHDDATGNQSIGVFAIGADGRLLTIWADGIPQGSDPAHIGIDLKARLFDSLNVYNGTDNDDGITGSNGPDLINGGGGNDSLVALGGNDYLNGGTGNDHMVGGAGNDVYYVDSTFDVVTEANGEGYDRIATSVSLALAAGSEIELLEAITLTDTTPLNLSGNDLAQTIIGNAGSNIILGLGGNDRLEGGGGDDYLVGGTGADLMFGNSGNDTFYVDNSADQVFEAGGDGVDRVATSASFQLGAGADVQRLEAVNLGDATPLDLIGNAIGQTIVGNAGANLLDGGAGADVLTGYTGADTFRFSTALGAGNVDVIEDFQGGTDRIALDDAIFTALTAGALPPGAFVTGAAAQDADDRIIYNSSTGQLFYDADGNGAGAAVQFATLTAAPSLAASDFLVI